jgi:PhnB protein
LQVTQTKTDAKGDDMTGQILEAFAYLRVRNANEAIEFYKTAFGANQVFRLCEPSGRVAHAELKFGPHVVMVSDEYPEYEIFGPEAGRPTGSCIHLHVDDVDAFTKRAVSAGAKLTREPADQFYGERSSKVIDPYGHEWYLGSKIEDVSCEEMQQRFAAMFEDSE